VVCKEAFRFFVDAATFEVGQCTEQKARHSAIRSNLVAHFNLNVAVYYCRRRGKRKMRSWANCRQSFHDHSPNSKLGLNTNPVIRSRMDSLFAAEIAFRRLHRDMPEKKLDLL